MNRLNLILLCGLILVSFLFFRSCEQAANDRDQLSTLLRATEQEIEYWQEADGVHKARAITHAADIKILREHYMGYLDSLRVEVKGLKKNFSNLESSIQAGTVTERNTIETRLIPDSTGHKFSYKDEWLEIKGTVDTDLLTIDKLLSRDSLSFVSYYKSKGLFKGSELTIEATSYNPHSRFTGIRNFSVDVPRKRFSVGPYVGYGTGGVQIGLGVQYSVLRF